MSKAALFKTDSNKSQSQPAFEPQPQLPPKTKSPKASDPEPKPKMLKYFANAHTVKAPDLLLLREVMDMFTYKRPYAFGQGIGYKAFTQKFIMPLVQGLKWDVDAVGNIFVDLRQEEHHRTLFTAHTDSVHREDGRQTVEFNEKTGLISVLDGSCLGADDAAGIALMLHMIRHRVPAGYLFTVGEEVGGVGAKYLAEERGDLLAQFERAIAFDRRDEYSVITHQGFGRCCSDEFAEAFSDALSNDELMYMPDDSGIYTDTAEFTAIIPECTNISVGYMHEHTQSETLAYFHFAALARRLLEIDFDSLPVVREAGDDDDEWFYTPNSYEYGTEGTMSLLSIIEDEIFNAVEAANEGDTEALISTMVWAVSYELGYSEQTIEESINLDRLTPSIVESLNDTLGTYGPIETMIILYDQLEMHSWH